MENQLNQLKIFVFSRPLARELLADKVPLPEMYDEITLCFTAVDNWTAVRTRVGRKFTDMALAPGMSFCGEVGAVQRTPCLDGQEGKRVRPIRQKKRAADAPRWRAPAARA